MAEAKQHQIRHNLQRRLEFVEFRLYWEGQINRGDLVDTFGISVPQASADLQKYQSVAPGNIEYDAHRKAYRPTEDFAPRYLHPSGDAYLARLRLRESGFVAAGETWAERVPEFSVVPILRRTVEAAILRQVMAAVRESEALKIRYQSTSSSSPTWRWITPHALGFDGFRWHARSWCDRRQDFRDFVLTRVLDVGESRLSDAETEKDSEWHTAVTFVLQPNPRLGPGAQKAVELDYGMVNGKTSIETRVCLSFYLERHLGLDQDEDETLPVRQRLVLTNRQEVESVRSTCCQGR